MERMPSIIHPSWHPFLQPLFNDKRMIAIRDKLLSSDDYYPSSENIFRVFSMPLSEIKVVILGQDPYPNGEAIGLAFAVNKNCKIPGSLRIIHKEVENTVESPDPSTRVDKLSWITLEHWVSQGVFLLNTALTVKRKGAGSHLTEWEWFTGEVIKIIGREASKPLWLLWGAKAQKFKNFIPDYLIMDEQDIEMINPTNGVFIAPHPAAELYGGPQKFTGCNHFNMVNRILELRKQEKINW